MQKIGLEEQKRLQLDILCSVHDFCLRNSITYFLSSGTLIGAIRHKGYIPWDDDIDIAMPRKDYDRFFQLYGTDIYTAMNLDKDEDWPYMGGGKVYDTRTTLTEEHLRQCNYKGLGVNIDVFPLDGLPDKKLARRLYLCEILAWRRLIVCKISHPQSEHLLKHLCRKTISLLIKPIPVRIFFRKLNKLLRRYDWDKSSVVASLATITERVPCGKSCFASTQEQEFEGHLFHIPCGYDTWLRLIYGDYMKLPPLCEQLPHHNADAYWNDRT